MRLFLLNIHDVKTEHIQLISPERAEKARRYKFPADQKRCIAGGLLLRAFLGEAAVAADEFGKPRASSGVCFNLSHSGDWAALVLGETEVGCDIEQIKQVNPFRLGKVVYTEQELMSIENSADRQGRFFELWTKKEALLKCMGNGFHRAAKTVDVCGDSFVENGKVYRLKTKLFSDYAVSVCVENDSADFEVEFLTVEQLLALLAQK